MIHCTHCVFQRSRDVSVFKVRIVTEDLVPRGSLCQHLKDIGNPDPHAPNARFTSRDSWIGGDPPTFIFVRALRNLRTTGFPLQDVNSRKCVYGLAMLRQESPELQHEGVSELFGGVELDEPSLQIAFLRCAS